MQKSSIRIPMNITMLQTFCSNIVINTPGTRVQISLDFIFLCSKDTCQYFQDLYISHYMYGYMYVSANIIIIRISIKKKKKTQMHFDHFSSFFTTSSKTSQLLITLIYISVLFLQIQINMLSPSNTENCIPFKIQFFFLSSELICAHNKI